MGPLRAVKCSVVTGAHGAKAQAACQAQHSSPPGEGGGWGGLGGRRGPLAEARPPGTVCPLSRPGRASALLHTGCHPVSVRHCPHPTLLSPQDPGAEGSCSL